MVDVAREMVAGDPLTPIKTLVLKPDQTTLTLDIYDNRVICVHVILFERIGSFGARKSDIYTREGGV